MISSLLTSFEMIKEIEAEHKNGYKAIAYLPVGCIEQHGPFLPVETDSLIAEAFAHDVCSRMLQRKYWGYVFPTVHYGPTKTNMSFCGTVSVSEEPFRAYMRQICSSVIKSPFDALVIISGHGPADSSLKEISFNIVNEQFPIGSKQLIPVLVLSVFENSLQIEERFKQKVGKHADWREFLMLYHLLGEDYFDSSRINQLKKFSDKNSFDNTASLIYGIPLEYRSTSGVIGEPLPNKDTEYKTLANEVWECLLSLVIERLFEELELFNEKWAIKSLSGKSTDAST